MFWIVLSIIVVVVLFVIIGLANARSHNGIIKGNMLIALLGFFIIIPAFFSKIPANSVGISYSIFTGTSENTLSEGVHAKNPLDKVYVISTEVQTMTVANLTTQTQDAQYVNSALDIKYRINPTNAYLVFKQYRTLDAMSSSLIVPTTQRVLELITTEYNVIDILGSARSEIYGKLEIALTEELAKYGVEFYSVSITDMDAGIEIETAITAEAVAKKAVETAEQELLKAETEAKKKSVTAQAEQEAAIIDAQTRVIEAQAEKDANDLMSQSLTDQILRQQWIEKWNGEMPTYYGGEDTGLMFSVDGSQTTPATQTQETTETITE